MPESDEQTTISPDPNSDSVSDGGAAADRLDQLARMQQQLMDEFADISTAGLGTSDAGSYSGGSRPAGSSAETLADTEENAQSAESTGTGASDASGGGAYSLYSGHAGSRERGDSSNTPPAYTAGDQAGSNPPGNTGVSGETIAQSALMMLTGGPLGIISGLMGLFGGAAGAPVDLTRYAMPSSMEFEGTTTGGTDQDSFSASAEPRGPTTPADTAGSEATSTTSTTVSGAPAQSDAEWIAANASGIATAVQGQIQNLHPLYDTIQNL